MTLLVISNMMRNYKNYFKILSAVIHQHVTKLLKENNNAEQLQTIQLPYFRFYFQVN